MDFVNWKQGTNRIFLSSQQEKKIVISIDGESESVRKYFVHSDLNVKR